LKKQVCKTDNKLHEIPYMEDIIMLHLVEGREKCGKENKRIERK